LEYCTEDYKELLLDDYNNGVFTWTDKDGESHLIYGMSDSYIQNVIGYLSKLNQTEKDQVNIASREAIMYIFEQEQIERLKLKKRLKAIKNER